MRRVLKAFWRYRPRVLTLVVLFVVGAPLVLANLSFDYDDPFHNRRNQGGFAGYWVESYGWPLIWLRYVDVSGFSIGMMGHYYSIGRLAGNVVICLVLLAVPVAVCEWLLRRYRPRFHWNLKTMLGAVVPTAALFAVIAALRNAADVQDEHIAAILGAKGGSVWVERWGPKWLDVVGADRFRRRVVGVELDQSWAADEESVRMLRRLEQLPSLRFLELHSIRLRPAKGDALAELRQLQFLTIHLDNVRPGEADPLARMPQLRGLRIAVRSMPVSVAEALARMRNLRVFSFHLPASDDENDSDRIMAAVGTMAELEHLRLDGVVTCSGLAGLDGLKRLKTLVLDVSLGDEDFEDASQPLLSSLPPLPQLESLSLEGITDSNLVDEDIRYIARLPRLKSLRWPNTMTDGGLGKLLSLRSVEELAIDWCEPTELDDLRALRSLRTLHLPSYLGDGRSPIPLDRGTETHVVPAARDNWIRALEQLRQSKPGIVIDSDPRPPTFAWPDDPRTYDTEVEHPVAWRPKRPRWPWNLPANPGFAAWAAQVGIPSSF